MSVRRHRTCLPPIFCQVSDRVICAFDEVPCYPTPGAKKIVPRVWHAPNIGTDSNGQKPKAQMSGSELCQAASAALPGWRIDEQQFSGEPAFAARAKAPCTCGHIPCGCNPGAWRLSGPWSNCRLLPPRPFATQCPDEFCRSPFFVPRCNSTRKNRLEEERQFFVELQAKPPSEPAPRWAQHSVC
jgi:hypothetical protein